MRTSKVTGAISFEDMQSYMDHTEHQHVAGISINKVTEFFDSQSVAYPSQNHTEGNTRPDDTLTEACPSQDNELL
ncbi:hypothetical protein E2C01_070378 [Portunus trituberculatus]|uniref:Uncharacterized protein n=1 Tax=Portunus trituberculatus TaxID=210409 RepID=A0A5B7I3C0_PORTR|nr:hypothetical protein [Portunus trituberculatus]